MTQPKRILIVDDDKLNRKVLTGMLRSLGHEVLEAMSGFQALKMIEDNVDLVLLDVMMPGLDGFEVTRRIRASNQPDLPVVIVTTLSGQEERLEAVKSGANDFIAKPIDLTELSVRTASLLRMKESSDALKRYQQQLEDMVSVRTQALQLAMENLRELQLNTVNAHQDTIMCLSAAAEFKDEDTAHHIKRMSHYSALLARRVGLSDEEVEVVQYASPMHDVGKIGVPDAILLKPGKLTPDEWEIMKRHTLIGKRILGESTSELLQAGSTIAMTHHERWDGSGYPHGLAGKSIPLYGRICAIADVYDALTSRRPYKEAFPTEKALGIMREGRGSHFDPTLLDHFFDCLDEVFRIQEDFSD